MQSCELIMAISTLACWIAQDRTPDEIKQISNIYIQLGTTLNSIALQDILCELITKEESEDS